MKRLPKATSEVAQPVPVTSPNGEATAARVRYGYGEVPDPEASSGDSEGLLAYWSLLKRNRGRLALSALVGALLGVLVSLPQTPIYRAHTTLEIEPLNENFLNLRDVNPTAATTSPFSTEYDIATQVKVLQSRALLQRVTEKLGLHQRLEELSGTGRWAAWSHALGWGIEEHVPPSELALELAEENFTVEPSRKTRIVEVVSYWPEAELAAAFANVLAETFIEYHLESHWESTQRTGHWLNRQLGELRVRLETSEEKLQDYARQSGLLFTAEEDSVEEEKLRQLQEELSRAQADRIDKQSRYELAVKASPESLPDILDHGPLVGYQMRLADLQRQHAELTATLTPAHYRVKRVQAQIDGLEQTMRKERSLVLARIRNEFKAANRREALLALNYQGQASLVTEQANRAIEYNIYKREVDTNRELYDNLLQKVKEAGVASAIRASNIRVVDPATPPRQPYRPSHALNAALGLLAGLLMGVALVFIGERADRTIKQPGDSVQYIGVAELGVIPASSEPSSREDRKRASDGLRRQLKEAKRLGPGPRKAGLVESPGQSIELASWQQKPTLISEYFRAALTSILFAGEGGAPPRLLVVTSPSPGEGKTTVASNLAICMAEINRRVLLIDADMRKPRMHKVFHAPNRRGLSDLLQEREPITSLESECHVTQVPNLWVLPSGSPTHSIPNLLHSTRTAELLLRAQEEFDSVLIDTPPMLQISDARVLAQITDGVILVVRAGQTTRGTAKAAADRFLEDGSQVLGTILNSWDPKSNGYGYYGSYYYYDGYYSNRSEEEGQREKAS